MSGTFAASVAPAFAAPQNEPKVLLLKQLAKARVTSANRAVLSVQQANLTQQNCLSATGEAFALVVAPFLQPLQSLRVALNGFEFGFKIAHDVPAGLA